MITSKVGGSSGGINTANLSRGYGGSAGKLAGHTTTQVSSAVLDAQAADKVRRGGSGKAARSEEEIALVFDRNKGAIFALYNRALREDPTLAGKLVLLLCLLVELEMLQDLGRFHCQRDRQVARYLRPFAVRFVPALRADQAVHLFR